MPLNKAVVRNTIMRQISATHTPVMKEYCDIIDAKIESREVDTIDHPFINELREIAIDIDDKQQSVFDTLYSMSKLALFNEYNATPHKLYEIVNNKTIVDTKGIRDIYMGLRPVILRGYCAHKYTPHMIDVFYSIECTNPDIVDVNFKHYATLDYIVAMSDNIASDNSWYDTPTNMMRFLVAAVLSKIVAPPKCTTIIPIVAVYTAAIDYINRLCEYSKKYAHSSYYIASKFMNPIGNLAYERAKELRTLLKDEAKKTDDLSMMDNTQLDAEVSKLKDTKIIDKIEGKLFDKMWALLLAAETAPPTVGGAPDTPLDILKSLLAAIKDDTQKLDAHYNALRQHLVQFAQRINQADVPYSAAPVDYSGLMEKYKELYRANNKLRGENQQLRGENKQLRDEPPLLVQQVAALSQDDALARVLKATYKRPQSRRDPNDSDAMTMMRAIRDIVESLSAPM